MTHELIPPLIAVALFVFVLLRTKFVTVPPFLTFWGLAVFFLVFAWAAKAEASHVLRNIFAVLGR